MVAGAGYYAGTKMQQYQQREADEDARLADLEAQQRYSAPPPQAPPSSTPASGQSVAEQLTQLKSLLDSGALTQAEFDAEKAHILRG